MLTAVLVAAACGSSDTNADGSASVSVRTDVFYTGAVLPLLVGVDKGIYRKHGLDVTLHEGKGSSTTIQTVGNGSDDIGYADAGTLVQSAAKGIPVEMVTGMVQRSPLAIFARAKSGITGPQDLAGKTGGYSSGSAQETLFPAYAKATGLDPDSVHFNKVDVPSRDSIFLQGKTQFTFGLLNVTKPILKSKCHCQLRTLSYADAGITALSSGIFTSTDYSEDHPKRLKKFLAATADAVQYTNDHPDKAVDSFFQVAKKSTLSKSVVKHQWQASAKLLHSKTTKNQPFGCMATSDWASTIDLMERYASVPNGEVTPQDVASNQYLPKSCSSQLSKE